MCTYKYIFNLSKGYLLNTLLFQVNLYRNITFKNSKQIYNGIPVMASNMDTVGTFQIAKALSKVIIACFCTLL